MNTLTDWIEAHPPRMGAYRTLAAAAGVAWQQVPKWAHRGEVPLRRVAAISRVTGIQAHLLNPQVQALLACR